METRQGGELRALGGRRVAGTLLRYGDVARIADGRSERFEATAFSYVPKTIPVNLQHDEKVVVGEVQLENTATAIRAEGMVSEGVHSLIRRGSLGGLSVEFRAKRERQEAAPLHGRSVRVIEAADLLGAGLVDMPAYPDSGVEARRRIGGVSGGFRTGTKLDCRCAVQDCTSALIEADALTIPPENVQAFLSDFSKPLGPATVKRAGPLVTVSADVPSTSYGSDLLEAPQDALIVRPYPDAARSSFVKDGLVSCHT